MTTVHELILMLQSCPPYAEVQLTNTGYRTIKAQVRTERDCKGPYQVVEIFNEDKEEA